MLYRNACGPDRHQLLNDLCKMCSRRRVVPTSMRTVSCLKGEPTEEYNGGHGIIFRSELKGHAVAVKTLRLYLTSDFDKCLSVCMFALCSAEPPSDTGILGIL